MRDTVIIGAGESGKAIAGEILKEPQLKKKHKLIGFIDNRPEDDTIMGFPLLADLESAPEIIKNKNIYFVFIALPYAEKHLIRKIINSLKGLDVEIKIISSLYELIEGDSSFIQDRNIEASEFLNREEVDFDREKIAPFYRDKTILITGAGGSIGSEIFFQLFNFPIKKVIALGHGENSIHRLIRKFQSEPRFEYIIGDIRDYPKLEREFLRFRPDIIFHAAAHKHVPIMEKYPDEAIKNNILGTETVARAAIKAGVGDFVFISTDKAVNPRSIMGATKRVAELIILSLNKTQTRTHFSVTRFGNVLGSRGDVFHIFQEQIENGGPVTVTHPEMTRFYMSIREAASLVLKSLTINEGSIFVLDMGKPMKIVDLAKKLIRFHGYTEEEIPIHYTQPRPGEKLYEEIMSDPEALTQSVFEKLFISGEPDTSFDKESLEEVLRKFREAADNGSDEEIRKLIHDILPEFQGGGYV